MQGLSRKRSDRPCTFLIDRLLGPKQGEHSPKVTQKKIQVLWQGQESQETGRQTPPSSQKPPFPQSTVPTSETELSLTKSKEPAPLTGCVLLWRRRTHLPGQAAYSQALGFSGVYHFCSMFPKIILKIYVFLEHLKVDI